MTPVPRSPWNKNPKLGRFNPLLKRWGFSFSENRCFVECVPHRDTNLNDPDLSSVVISRNERCTFSLFGESTDRTETKRTAQRYTCQGNFCKNNGDLVFPTVQKSKQKQSIINKKKQFVQRKWKIVPFFVLPFEARNLTKLIMG